MFMSRDVNTETAWRERVEDDAHQLFTLIRKMLNSMSPITVVEYPRKSDVRFWRSVKMLDDLDRKKGERRWWFG